MKTVVQTREFTNGPYQGVVYDKIIFCWYDLEVTVALYTKCGIQDNYEFKVLKAEVFDNFDPHVYAKTAKPINNDNLKRE